jgi:hypothetical protein
MKFWFAGRKIRGCGDNDGFGGNDRKAYLRA